MAHAEGRSAKDSRCYALKDSGWRYAAEGVEDEGVRKIQYADQEGGAGNDLPESRAIRGDCHLE
jgi:hypothetical protein